MLKQLRTYLVVFSVLLFSLSAIAQENKRIIIDDAPFLNIDETNFPGATILTRDNMKQVKITHEGATMWCDRAIHYKDEDFIEAFGNVKVKQGDSINMQAKYVEYSGKTKLAFASGDVILTDPSSILTTDTLYFDRAKQQAYYQNKGQVVRDTSGTITSQIGRYYVQNKKYQFVQDVTLVNEEYTINSDQLDFYSETGHAYLFGPTTIVSESSTIYCERGFYDTNDDTGYFVRNSRIDYDNRIFEGDSMYFDRNKSFASATNNIKVTDTTNQTFIRGHYAEVFRELDSVFITKRALAINVQEQDSVYVHGDTLMVTGKTENRVTRAFRNVKLYKSDMSGKADSIHVDHKSGLTQLINFYNDNSNDAFSVKRSPVLWNLGNQMTGDSIHIWSNPETEKIDTLKVFDNAFLVSQDTISGEFNQISGQKLYGFFDENNKLNQVDIIKNAQSIFYARDENQELFGIDKAKSGSITIFISEGQLDRYIRYKQVTGDLYPEEDFPEKEKILKGFAWREDERPKSVDDLFADDPPLELPVIKGLKPYVPQEEFFDEALMNRVDKADQSKKRDSQKDKASRQIPKPNGLKKTMKPTIGNPKKDN